MRVIYFDIDSLRPDHLGCYGYDRPTSPAIDTIAQEGMRFNRYYCSDSPCMPSRHGLMSGRGVLVRHLVMPGGLDESREIMRFLAQDTYVNIMAQYHPMAKVSEDLYPEINRGIRSEEKWA